jgi:O-antigen/teichoic acid export membrane protein
MLGTGMAAVITPYFSSFMARKHLLSARQELSFLMAFVTVILVPVSLSIHLLAPDLIKVVLGKGLPDNGNLDNIILIMRLGILQLPFFTCNMLLVKFATAQKKTHIITYAAAFGLACNIILDFILIKFLSIAGIALATSLSMLISTGLLLIYAHYSGHISWFDLLSTLLSWALYLTLIVCLSFKSYAGVVVVTGAYLILLVKQIRNLLSSESILPVSEHAA